MIQAVRSGSKWKVGTLFGVFEGVDGGDTAHFGVASKDCALPDISSGSS